MCFPILLQRSLGNLTLSPPYRPHTWGHLDPSDWVPMSTSGRMFLGAVGFAVENGKAFVPLQFAGAEQRRGVWAYSGVANAGAPP